MDWIAVIWPVLGAICLTLGLIHLLLCVKRGWNAAHLLFAVTAFSVMAISVFELVLLHAQTPDAYAAGLRWAHFFGGTMFVGALLFVHVQFRPYSRPWLMWLAVATRAAAVAANFLTGVNLNYASIDSLTTVSMWGVMGAHPVGTLNPWWALGLANIVVIVVYLLDTMRSAWLRRRGDEAARAVRVCGAVAAFVLLSTVWRAAVVTGTIDGPDLLIPSFLCVVVVMSYELAADMFRSVELAADLTRAEAQLRDSEIRADLAIDAARLGLWTWNTGRGRAWVSARGRAMLGLGDGPFDPRALLERIPEIQRPRVIAALAKAREGGDFDVGFRLDGLDGHGPRWFTVRGQLIAGEDGDVPRLHGTIADETDRRLADERFQLLVEASPTAMLMVDASGLIAMANRQAELVFGYPREQLVGVDVETLVPPRASAGHRAQRRAFAAAPSVRTMGIGRELFALRRDGVQIPVEIALNPVRTPEGTLVLASITDISERRRQERESALRRDELAHLSRVGLLAELSGSLAHELNQPLMAILSNAQAGQRFLARSPPDLDEIREILAAIVESDKRAGEVIRRMRAMLRKEPASHEPLDLNEAVHDVLGIVRGDLLHRGTTATLDLAPDLPLVYGDRVQLQQVLMNLLMNATDAMSTLPTTDREITVRTRATPEGGVAVDVADRGCGIAADELEGIFAPFTTTKGTGLGLGLAVCQTIIGAHRGSLWATSEPGEGATLHFTLPPLSRTEGAANPAPQPA